MDTKKRSTKRKRHTGGKVAGGVALLALLLAGGHFGLGIGREGGGFLTAEAMQNAAETVSQTYESAKELVTGTAEPTLAPTAEPTAEPTQAPTAEPIQAIVIPVDDGVLTVTVRQDKLLYEGRETTLMQLEEDILRDYKAGTSAVELIDDHAIKAAYDEAKALLEKLSIPFTAGKE